MSGLGKNLNLKLILLMFICCSSSFLPKLQRFINFLNKCIIFNMKRGVSDLWFQYDISDNHIYFAKSYIHPIRS
jgi:hypothetical protein